MLVKELVENMACGIIDVRDSNGTLLSCTESLHDMRDSIREREIEFWQPVKYKPRPAILIVVRKKERDINEIMDDMNDLVDEFFDYADSCGVGALL